jgi:hypothetical protein
MSGALRHCWKRALPCWADLGDAGPDAGAHHAGRVGPGTGDAPRAALLLEESVRLCRELGDNQGHAEALHQLGRVAYMRRATTIRR